jgi:D-alanyl-D-alanine carboxypeptidase (penicillin-binding protein 5/6)
MVMIARRLVALSIVLLTALAAAGLAQPAAAQIPYSSLLSGDSRYAAIVVDANSGEVLYDRNADAQRHPASITKIMTLYLTFEALAAGRLSLSDRVYVSAHAAAQAPTKLGVRAGSSVSVDEAIRAIAVKSANDMAVAMAEKLGGSESRFATLMTLRAQELGMHNTTYVNASGLPDNRQISSARDIALLSRSVMRDYPQYYSYFGLRQFAWRGAAFANHNHLLASMPGVDGLKTGYTNASGFNLSASAVRNGRRLIAVVMGGSSTAARDNNVEDLLNAGFEVLAKRDQGQTVTVAQNLFEPEAAGPVSRPVSEQGDADQSGLKIILGDNSAAGMKPIPDASEAQPLLMHAADTDNCTTRRIVRHGRHGHRTVVVSNTCGGAHLVSATSVHVCKAKHGRHAASCRAAIRTTRISVTHARNSSRHHAHSNIASASGRRSNRQG